MELPEGVVTFLLTDIEGSTRLWEHHPTAMSLAVARHNELAEKIISGHHGYLIKERGEGDSLFAVFADASLAIKAAVDLQLAIAIEGWPDPVVLRVRIGIHTGEAAKLGTDYFGQTVNRAARVRALGYGGQILISGATRGVADGLGAELLDLGWHRLKDLEEPEHIFQVLHPELQSRFPPLRSVDVSPTNLGHPLTRFIGRADELEEILALLDDSRIITLTGPGGAGKTRLATELGRRSIGRYEDGVWIVELVDVSKEDRVPEAIMNALGVRERPHASTMQRLIEHLSTRTLLLILDNCEHLLEASREIAEELLTSCPSLKILATSRQSLGVPGERLWEVKPMTTPPIATDPKHMFEFDSVALFTDRAKLARPGLELASQQAETVGKVVTALDGIPLAIELAARQLRFLELEEVYSRLDRALSLQLPGGSNVPHHATLRTTIDWSFNLLSELEREVLTQVSVFPSSFSIEAADAVTQLPPGSDLVALLASLVDKSMVLREEWVGSSRFRMLQMVRQYANEKLASSGSETSTLHRFLGFFVGLAHQATAGFSGADEGRWLDLIHADYGNLQQAIDLASEKEDLEAELVICRAVARYWGVRGLWTEGRARLESLLSRSTGAPERLIALAANSAGALAQFQGDYDAARRLMKRALDSAQRDGDKALAGKVLNNLGVLAHRQGDPRSARMHYEDALEVLSVEGEAADLTATLNNLGAITQDDGDLVRARDLYEQSLELSRKAGTESGILLALHNLAEVAQLTGALDEARSLFEQSTVVAQRLGDRRRVAMSLVQLGGLALSEGRREDARASLKVSLEAAEELGDRHILVEVLEMAGRFAEQDPSQASFLLGAAEGVRQDMGLAPAANNTPVEISKDRIRTSMGEQEFLASWRMGVDAAVEEAVAVAEKVLDQDQ